MPLYPRSASSIRVAFVVLSAGLALPACSASPPLPPATPVSVIELAAGPQLLGDPPASSGGSRLLLAGTNAAADEAPPATRGCYEVTAILAEPAPSTRVFALSGGKLHAFASRNAKPVPLPGGNDTLTLTRLLAFAHATPPVTLLVAARPPKAQYDQIWTLTVDQTSITGATQLTNLSAYTNPKAFFDAFNAPRCKSGGKDCLVPSTDGKTWFLDLQPTRGARPTTLRPLPQVALDASWTSADGNEITLLVPCPPPPKQAPASP